MRALDLFEAAWSGRPCTTDVALTFGIPDRPAELHSIDLNEFVEDLLEDVAPLLHRHRPGIARSWHLHVLADPARLRQVLEHLLENSEIVESTDDGTVSTGSIVDRKSVV